MDCLQHIQSFFFFFAVVGEFIFQLSPKLFIAKLNTAMVVDICIVSLHFGLQIPSSQQAGLVWCAGDIHKGAVRCFDSDWDRREVRALFNFTAAMFEVKREKQMVYVFFFACLYTLTVHLSVHLVFV